MYAAYSAQYKSAIEFIRSMRAIPTTDKVLNEAYEELNLDKGTFARFKFEYLNLKKFTEYSGHKIQALTSKVETSKLNTGILSDEAYIAKFNRSKGVYYTLKMQEKLLQVYYLKCTFHCKRIFQNGWETKELLAVSIFSSTKNKLK